jgi:hypothetical protein
MRIEEIRRSLADRLRERHLEIEQATLTRIDSVADSPEGTDPEYTDGLRAAVTAAIDYGIEAVERSEDRPPPMPTVLLAQARLAARHGVKLETVLRRYLAGYTLLGDFLIEESDQRGPLRGASLRRLLRVQAALLDRLIAAISEEYAREATIGQRTSEQRRVERVERLLAGEFVDASELAYDLGANHLGAIATGPGAGEALGRLSKTIDRRLLLIRRGEVTIWAWLGSERDFDPEELESLTSCGWPRDVSIAFGEPARGLAGWRLTHRQAKAGLRVAARVSETAVRYADVALLASILEDDLLATSLRQRYLIPLSEERDGGELQCKTLRAYFATGRNVSSAAAALGVSRQTVGSRLRAVEEKLSRSLDSCAVELELALRLEACRFV